MSRACSVCKITKSAEYFYKSSSAKDGLACRCKECELTYGRSRKEEKKASNGRWFAKNGDAYKQKLRDQSKAKRLKKFEFSKVFLGGRSSFQLRNPT